MNSTFITCLFNLRRNEKEDDTHETSVNLQSQRKTHHQNIEPHGSQRVLQTLVYFLCQNAEMKCTMKLQAIPSVQPMLMTEKLQDIDHTNSSPASMGGAHKFRSCFNKI